MTFSELPIFKADRAGAPQVVALGDRGTDDIVLGDGGAPIAKANYEPKSGRWALLMSEGSAWRTSRVITALIERPQIAGLGRDGRSVVIGLYEDGEFRLREVAADGAWGATLDVSGVDGLIFDPQNHRLIGTHVLVGDEENYSFFDPKDQRAWAGVVKAFKGDRVRLESWSADRRKIVVLADSPTMGPAYALVDLDAKRATWLGGQFQQLTQADISPVKPLAFKARDGLPLTGYLTTPFGAAARNLPLVVFPHGGPAARDAPGFDWWAQAMASRGYAVLQVNFRGSDGFGRPFLEAGFGEWGRKMQTDLSDGVRALVSQGMVDPKRVCIVGGSYGGYAALAGATIDTGVYRCAASVAGPADLGRMVSWSRSHNGVVAFRYWTRFMGAEENRARTLAEISPAAQVARANIPILLVHGKDDTVVPLEQSKIMASALQKAGKPVEFVTMAGEDHWLSRGETRLQMLQAVMAFLEKHNPPN